MDPILAEVYSTVLPAAPYVLVAYVGIWAVLAVYMLVVGRRAKRASADIEALRRAFTEREQRHNDQQ